MIDMGSIAAGMAPKHTSRAGSDTPSSMVADRVVLQEDIGTYNRLHQAFHGSFEVAVYLAGRLVEVADTRRARAWAVADIMVVVADTEAGAEFVELAG